MTNTLVIPAGMQLEGGFMRRNGSFGYWDWVKQSDPTKRSVVNINPTSVVTACGSFCYDNYYGVLASNRYFVEFSQTHSIAIIFN
jgi:hypothetical protein